MQKVKLVGEIAKFGSSWETNCANIADIFKLIDCQTPGFRQHLVEGAEAGVGYTIKRGQDYLEEGEELLLSLNNEDIIITEIPAGAKSGMGKKNESVQSKKRTRKKQKCACLTSLATFFSDI